MLNSVIRSKIFSEFTPEEQNRYFSIRARAVSPHVDSLYYCIYLEGDDPNVSHAGILGMLDELNAKKIEKIEFPDASIKFFELEVFRSGAAMAGGLYAYHVGLDENFDVYISPYIPNSDTPRIQVQIRTYSLVIDGLYNALHKSFDAVVNFLSYYGIRVEKCSENRIDFAFHTNVIQTPERVFNDEFLNKHLHTSFNRGNKEFAIRHSREYMFDYDYLALGRRKSNCVFFRAYNKTKEVVQMSYKAFFFEIWRSRGLISEYDEYVLRTAYELKSWSTGVNVGRCRWYLEHGKDPELKERISKLLQSCNIKSDNNPYLEKAIAGVLPPVTLIMNFEFETKHKFYYLLDEALHDFNLMKEQRPELNDIYRILLLRPQIFKILLNEKVAFREDRKFPDSPPMAFWKRVQQARIRDEVAPFELSFWYTYNKGCEIKRTERRLCNAIVQLSVLKNNDISEATFGQDLWDAITLLNDNDKQFVSAVPDQDKFLKLDKKGYSDVRTRKIRQIKPMIRDQLAEAERQREEEEYKALVKKRQEEYNSFVKKRQEEKKAREEAAKAEALKFNNSFVEQMKIDMKK